MSQNNDYIDQYRRYMSEINEINKNLRIFKLKKGRIIKKEIFASNEEVSNLENLLAEKFEIEGKNEIAEEIKEFDEKHLADEAKKSEMDQVQEEIKNNESEEKFPVEENKESKGNLDYNETNNQEDSLDLHSLFEKDELDIFLDNEEDKVDVSAGSMLLRDELSDDLSLFEEDDLLLSEEDDFILDQLATSTKEITVDNQDKEFNESGLDVDFDIDLDDLLEEDALKFDLRSDDEKQKTGDNLIYAEDYNEKEENNLNPEQAQSREKIYQFSNGDVFIGRIIKGNMEGTGSYIFEPNGNLESNDNMEYMGEFINSIRSGGGSFIYKNGNEYVGNFENNFPNGVGRMKYKNGDEYLGHWKNGKKDGHGIYTWNDGSVYIGDFNNSKMQGIGLCYDENGDLIYEGEWKNNLIDGFGTYIWDEGKFYEGEFKKGKKHGSGKFFLEGELIYDGTWKYDKPCIFNRTFDEIFAGLIK